MKRLFAILLALCLLLGCAAAETAAETGELQLTAKAFPVYFVSAESPLIEEFPLYFTEGADDLPFVDLADWRDLVIRLFARENPAPDEPVYELTLEIPEEGKRARLVRENGFSMTVDFETGKMAFDDYVAFVQQPGKAYMDVSGFPETQDGEPFLIKHTKDRVLYGDLTVVDLKEYDIPMAAQDGKYILPVQTLSAFMLSDIGIAAYFNGESLYISLISAMSDPKMALQTNLSLYGLLTPELLQRFYAVEGTAEDKLNFLLEEVEKISDKGREVVEQYKKDLVSSTYLKYTSVPKKDRSAEMIRYGFNELAMELDCFYGLKETHNIRDFRMFFLQSPLCSGLSDPDAAKADQAVADLTQFWFDDGHSGYISGSCLSGGANAAYNSGFNVADRQATISALAALRSQYPNAGLPYYEVGDTAYVTLDSFVATSGTGGFADYYALAKEGNLPPDTIGIICSAHKEITRENSPIKKVVLDLSCNNGGMVPAACYTLGWFLGEANYSYRNTFTGAQATHYIRSDVNLDHEFDEADTLAGRGLKLYCLISPQAFSCGNLVPWVFKANGSVTLLGRTSGGGSCIVGFNTTAWGASYRYSSCQQLSFVKNGSFYDVDRGVEPDFIIDDYVHFFDRDALTEFISGLF